MHLAWHWIAAVVMLLPGLVAQPGPTKNVLFLVADDLRPQIGAYMGADFPASVYPQMITPNIDRLASRSLQLNRAYTQQAVCAPSRSSFMTARRPDTTHVYYLDTYFRDVGGNYTTLPQYFKGHGYTTMGLGKIFHPTDGGNNDPISWTEPFYTPPSRPYWRNEVNVTWRAVTDEDRLVTPLSEDELANETIRRLRDLDQSGESFFMAVGMYKPHLPFVFPEEYLAYYPTDDVRLPGNPYVPTNMPPIAWYDWHEIRGYSDIKALNVTGEFNTTLPDNVTLYLRRAYYSAVSYVDDMFGLILNELDKLGIAENTIVSLVGDHGWQLGEHAEWGKMTNFELSTRVPMMLRIPGTTDAGWTTDELVELVDLYPSIVEAAGLPQIPLCSRNTTTDTCTCREGNSFMPLVRNETTGWKDRAFSQYPRNDTTVMGYSIKTKAYRYTEWVDFIGEPYFRPNWDIVHGVELYDHTVDQYENTNVAHDSAYQDVIEQLSIKLHGQWWATIK